MSYKDKFRNITPPSLNYYVYFIYLDHKPNPVYVGKGKGYRYRHYSYYPERVSNRILRRKLLDLKDSNKEYSVEIVFETDDEQEALDVEEFFISAYGRLWNRSGILYNFDAGGAKGSGKPSSKRRPVYIDGFVFDSVARANKVTGIKHSTIQKYRESGRASYLDSEEDIQRVFEEEFKMKYKNFYNRHEKAFKRAKKNFLISQSRLGEKNWMYGKATAISRKVTIDGVTYRSLSQAAEAFNFGKGYSLKRYLEKGNHNHIYEIH